MAIADADPLWAVGFEDECWWSRVALPTLSTFSEEKKPLRLIQRSVAKDDPDPKAISCYGLYLPELPAYDMWLRFVDGRPVSDVTTQFLSWCAEERARRAWQESPASHLGQRQLAHLQRGKALARGTQPGSEGERGGGEDCELFVAQAESVAECHRA
jgi:hypothetical protein